VVNKDRKKFFFARYFEDQEKLDETPRLMTEKENFSLAEAGDLTPADFFKKILDGTFDSEDH